jgi:hypothetical protein
MPGKVDYLLDDSVGSGGRFPSLIADPDGKGDHLVRMTAGEIEEPHLRDIYNNTMAAGNIRYDPTRWYGNNRPPLGQDRIYTRVGGNDRVVAKIRFTGKFREHR